MSGRQIVPLAGCRPEPLAGYLKALGVLRIVARQADPAVTGAWCDDHFTLSTTLTSDQIIDFFVDEYQPSPVVAPWNGGSGFHPKDQQAGIAAIESTTSSRLAAYREAIAAGRSLTSEAAQSGWDTDTLRRQARNRLPDACLDWIDASVVITGSRLAFPPLLGTGGNDGRLEFSNNFMQRLVDVLGLRTGRQAPGRADSAAWLAAALLGTTEPRGLAGAAIGQFDPSSAGSPNSSPFGSANPLVNPWGYVLMIEGSLLFASGPARRLGGGQGLAAAPFTFASSPVGYPGSAVTEDTRGEVWVPLWERFATLAEIQVLFSEGRANWRDRHARSGLDMAKAAATLGTARGIAQFARYAFPQRHGRNTVAVPVGRVVVSERPAARPLAQLDRWLGSLRSFDKAPAGLHAARHGLDDATWRAATGTGSLIDVLVAAAALEDRLSRATAYRRLSGAQPVQGLPAGEWVSRILDEAGTSSAAAAELSLALSLASMQDADTEGRPTACLRFLLRPVRRAPREWSLTWSDQTLVAGLGLRPAGAVLADAHVRRMLEVQPDADSRPQGVVGRHSAYHRALRAPLGAVVQFAEDRFDSGLFSRYLAGAMLLDWSKKLPTVPSRETDEEFAIPPALSVLGPLFHSGPIRLGRTTLRLIPQPSWPAQLRAGGVLPVLREGLVRLRMARGEDGPGEFSIVPLVHAERLAATAPPGALLAAALLCPVSATDAATLIRAIAQTIHSTIPVT